MWAVSERVAGRTQQLIELLPLVRATCGRCRSQAGSRLNFFSVQLVE